MSRQRAQKRIRVASGGRARVGDDGARSGLGRAWSRPWGKVLIIVVALAIVAAPAFGVWLVMRPTSTADAATLQIKSTKATATVGTATFQKSVSSTGTLAPTVQDDVSFAASGTVTAVDVAAGDTVTKGQVLATIDTLQLDAAAATAKANLATAQAQLASAQSADDGSAAAAAQVSARQAAVAVAQAAEDTATANLADSTLTAPDAGLVTEVNLAVGDTVSSGGSGGNGSNGGGASTGGASTGASTGSTGGGSTSSSSADFVVVGTNAWQVSVDVSENDVANVKVGQQVELTGTDLSQTVFGTVSAIALLPSTSSGTVTYPVTVAVTGSPKGLHDGVSVTAAIIYERRSNVLSVPAAAVTTAADGTTTVDVVGTGGKATPTTVTVGERNGQEVEITAGLTQGETVQYTQTTVTRTGGTGGTGTNPFGGFGGGAGGGAGGGGFGGFGGQGGGQGGNGQGGARTGGAGFRSFGGGAGGN
ncbi:MAG: efflux RND transporter periplasmic adaptor subunit [Promicromonosporaceae bacterium]|nr:efflux RND transporter periplasmic adaptor subunit [Promicromonosporaceae bacterium]